MAVQTLFHPLPGAVALDHLSALPLLHGHRVWICPGCVCVVAGKTIYHAHRPGLKSTNHMKYTLTFPEAAAVKLELSGGKGANLATLTQRGFPVPPGFIVTA